MSERKYVREEICLRENMSENKSCTRACWLVSPGVLLVPAHPWALLEDPDDRGVRCKPSHVDTDRAVVREHLWGAGGHAAATLLCGAALTAVAV